MGSGWSTLPGRLLIIKGLPLFSLHGASTLLSPAKPSSAALAAGYHSVMGSRWSTLPTDGRLLSIKGFPRFSLHDAPTLLSPAKPSSAALAAKGLPRFSLHDDAPMLLSPAKPSSAAPVAGYHSEVMGSRWSTLPDELLHLVLIRLSNMDRKSFESACTSWRSVAIQTPPRREPPLLFTGVRDRETLICYSFWESRIIRLRISSKFNGWQCEGASHGWLIMIDPSESKLCLINPITRAWIDLPLSSWAWFRRINYMALSSDPATSSRAVVAVTSINGDILVCRVGDEQWRILDNIVMYSGTIAFHKGLLCAQYFYGTRMVIYGRDYRRSSSVVVGCSDYRSRDSSSSVSFLIGVGEEEHQGEDLFQVIVHQRTRRCIVLKLVEDMDGGSPRWVQMKSLGGRALFVSKRYSELQTADDCAAMGLRGDLVYYWDQPNLLKFSVEDGKNVGIRTLSKICDCNCNCLSFWFNLSLPSRSENSLVCMD